MTRMRHWSSFTAVAGGPYHTGDGPGNVVRRGGGELAAKFELKTGTEIQINIALLGRRRRRGVGGLAAPLTGLYSSGLALVFLVTVSYLTNPRPGAASAHSGSRQ